MSLTASGISNARGAQATASEAEEDYCLHARERFQQQWTSTGVFAAGALRFYGVTGEPVLLRSIQQTRMFGATFGTCFLGDFPTNSFHAEQATEGSGDAIDLPFHSLLLGPMPTLTSRQHPRGDLHELWRREVHHSWGVLQLPSEWCQSMNGMVTETGWGTARQRQRIQEQLDLASFTCLRAVQVPLPRYTEGLPWSDEEEESTDTAAGNSPGVLGSPEDGGAPVADENQRHIRMACLAADVLLNFIRHNSDAKVWVRCDACNPGHRYQMQRVRHAVLYGYTKYMVRDAQTHMRRAVYEIHSPCSVTGARPSAAAVPAAAEESTPRGTVNVEAAASLMTMLYFSAWHPTMVLPSEWLGEQVVSFECPAAPLLWACMAPQGVVPPQHPHYRASAATASDIRGHAIPETTLLPVTREDTAAGVEEAAEEDPDCSAREAPSEPHGEPEEEAGDEDASQMPSCFYTSYDVSRRSSVAPVPPMNVSSDHQHRNGYRYQHHYYADARKDVNEDEGESGDDHGSAADYSLCDFRGELAETSHASHEAELTEVPAAATDAAADTGDEGGGSGTSDSAAHSGAATSATATMAATATATSTATAAAAATSATRRRTQVLQRRYQYDMPEDLHPLSESRWGGGYAPQVSVLTFVVELMRRRAMPLFDRDFFDQYPLLNYLYFKAVEEPMRDVFAAFEGQLQLPLQPLGHQLSSGVYEVFERDSQKYRQYREAVYHYVKDWYAAGPEQQHAWQNAGFFDEHGVMKAVPMPSNDERILHLVLLGCGRGPLIDECLNAVSALGVRLRIFAIEKNRPAAAFTQMRWANDPEWAQLAHTFGHTLEVLVVDGRHIAAAASGGQLRLPADFGLCDVVVSELLGSLGDNELSPECLEAFHEQLLEIQKARNVRPNPFLTCIPQSYTAWVAPLMSASFEAAVTEAAVKGLTVAPDNCADRHAALSHSLLVTNLNRAITLAPPQACWTFTHDFGCDSSIGSGAPAVSDQTTTEKHEDEETTKQMKSDAAAARLERAAHLVFRVPPCGRCGGIVGYFSAVLYASPTSPTTTLSTAPTARTQDMYSWFPCALALEPSQRRELYEVEMEAPERSGVLEIHVHLARKVCLQRRRVWYEWWVAYGDAACGPAEPGEEVCADGALPSSVVVHNRDGWASSMIL